MYALSVLQPWASLIVCGARPFEVRPWHPAHRGPLAIHASRRLPPGGSALREREPYRSALRRAGLGRWLPLGAVLGTVELTDCVRVEDLPAPSAEERALADFRPGHWVWRFRNPFPFPFPFPARGRLGLFRIALDPPAPALS